MMLPLRLSLAAWLATSTLFMTSYHGVADCDGQCQSEAEKAQVNLLQSALQMSVDKEVAQADSHKSSSNFGGIPSFTVDLDEAPESRWNKVHDYYLQTGLMRALWDDKPNAPQLSDEMRKPWWDAIKPQIDDEFMREASGTATYLHSLDPTINFTVQDILLSQFYYEENYPDFCSGVLAAMPNGTVIHGRNLDYGKSFLWKGHKIGWPELTVEVTMLRGGQPLYTSVTWALQLGVATAMRFGGWSIEQNTRDGVNMLEDLAAARQGGLGNNLFLRRLIEETPDFDTAVQQIWSANFMAPQYFILAGAKPYEGGVISVDRLGKHLPGTPPVMKLSEGAWHLVQTNDDLNKDPGDKRRPTEEMRLFFSDRNQVSPSWMFQQMTAEPIFNSDTTFSWVSIPATGFHQTKLPPGSIDAAQYMGLQNVARER